MAGPPEPEIFLLADLGNRFLKIGFSRGGRVVAKQRLEITASLKDQRLFDAERRFEAGRPARAVFASVNPDLDARFEDWAHDRYGLVAEKLGRDRPIPIHTECEGVGADRLLNALGAIERFPAGAIAVDAGTAVTVDVVAPGPVFLGGAILPGPHLGAWALAQRAAQLFSVTPGKPENPIARRTDDAIRSGLHHGAIGAIRELVDTFRSALDFDPTLVFSGGDVEPFLPAFPEAKHCPSLTLEGILVAVRKG
jgi:type III pantothenate kinase